MAVESNTLNYLHFFSRSLKGSLSTKGHEHNYRMHISVCRFSTGRFLGETLESAMIIDISKQFDVLLYTQRVSHRSLHFHVPERLRRYGEIDI